MKKYYQYYNDLPSIPNDIADIIVNFVENTNDNIVDLPDMSNFKVFDYQVDRIYEIHNQEIDESNLGFPGKDFTDHKDLVDFYYLEAPREVQDWAHKYISPSCHASVQKFCNGTYFFPHIDFIRVKALNYIFETGGPNVQTCFWRSKEEFKHLTPTAKTFFPYERIELEDSIVFPTNTWHSIDTTKIHSVENIERDKFRLSLSLSFFN